MNNSEYTITQNKKKFSHKLYAENDIRGKKESIMFLKNLGFQCIDKDEKYKEGDLIFKRDDKIITIEVEVRGKRSWDNGHFPFKTIHIPLRKKDEPVDYYFSFSNSLNNLIIIKSSIVKNEINRETINTQNDVSLEITHNETFQNISIEKTTEYCKINNNWQRIRKGKE